jgi:hypothetical protein
VSPEAEALASKIGAAHAQVRRCEAALEALRVRGVEAEQRLLTAQMAREDLQTQLMVLLGEGKKP